MQHSTQVFFSTWHVHFQKTHSGKFPPPPHLPFPSPLLLRAYRIITYLVCRQQSPAFLFAVMLQTCQQVVCILRQACFRCTPVCRESRFRVSDKGFFLLDLSSHSFLPQNLYKEFKTAGLIDVVYFFRFSVRWVFYNLYWALEFVMLRLFWSFKVASKSIASGLVTKWHVTHKCPATV